MKCEGTVYENLLFMMKLLIRKLRVSIEGPSIADSSLPLLLDAPLEQQEV